MIKIAEFAKALDLKVLFHSSKDEMNITLPDLNRPGMQFFGFYEYFSHERLQVIGKAEMTYLQSVDDVKLRSILTPFMQYPLPGIVICWGMTAPAEFLSMAKEHDIPILQSSKKTTVFTLQAITYLGRQLAPHETRHGVLVDVFGVGVLITGESGVGKSEAALELVKRGHQLCADDVVDICRVADDRLIGESPETIRHFMEIRGIGIIDIRAMYGVGAITLSKSIDIVIHLEKWDQEKEYDRLGLTEEHIAILNVNVPYQVMPVRPGRNLAIIIEVAARNLSLKRLGYSAASELDRRLSDMMLNSAENQQE